MPHPSADPTGRNLAVMSGHRHRTLEFIQGPVRHVTHHPILFKITQCHILSIQLIHRFLENVKVDIHVYCHLEENEASYVDT
jgi:hypothetical protein